jgi:hypothetical protein
MATDWASMSLPEILDAAEWDNDSIIALLIEFIDEKDLEDDLLVFLAEHAEAEAEED